MRKRNRDNDDLDELHRRAARGQLTPAQSELWQFVSWLRLSYRDLRVTTSGHVLYLDRGERVAAAWDLPHDGVRVNYQ